MSKLLFIDIVLTHDYPCCQVSLKIGTFFWFCLLLPSYYCLLSLTSRQHMSKPRTCDKHAHPSQQEHGGSLSAAARCHLKLGFSLC